MNKIGKKRIDKKKGFQTKKKSCIDVIKLMNKRAIKSEICCLRIKMKSRLLKAIGVKVLNSYGLGRTRVLIIRFLFCLIVFVHSIESIDKLT